MRTSFFGRERWKERDEWVGVLREVREDLFDALGLAIGEIREELHALTRENVLNVCMFS